MTEQYQLTEPEYREGMRAASKKLRAMTPLKWVILFVILTAVWTPLAFVGTSIAPAPVPPPPPHQATSLPEGALSVLPWLLTFVVLYIFIYRRLKKVMGFANNRELQRETLVEATHDQLTLTTSVTRFDSRWEAFRSLTESKNIFLLQQSLSIFVFIPKRAFRPEEVDAFRNICLAMITNRPTQAFPVGSPAPAAQHQSRE